ncbi:MAG: sulfite reductase flavoprotein subunit alpha [Pseudomonadota bacterium]
MNILFGSVTGTAENLARDAARVAQSRGHDVKLSELDEVSMEDLEDMDDILVVISTYGEGEMPFNAEMFWDELEAGEPVLDGVTYGVLALGDTAYKEFCQAGKDIDLRFEELGATRRVRRADCDLNYEDKAAAWIDKAIPSKKGDGATNGDAAAILADPASDKPSWSRTNPYTAQVTENRKLSGAESTKDMHHIVLNMAGSGLSYQAGDCVAVVPQNPPALIAAMLERLGGEEDTIVEGYDLPLGELLRSKFEIMTPPEKLVRAVNSVIKNDELAEACEADSQSFEAYLWNKDIIDILNVDDRLQVGADILLSLLQPLQHRTYSIASSPLLHPEELHLTVAAVRWQHENRFYEGVCSTHLSERLVEGTDARMFMVPNKRFRVPQDPDAPMIMVGPGTGVAPFIGFLQERKATGASGENWLFFGDRNEACDFIYRDELTALKQDGTLHRLDLAFSRDQQDKIYVQDRMRENGAAVFRALEAGGYFYLCGDAKNMAPDVERTLQEIIETHGTASTATPVNYISKLRREGRYLKDVY